MQISNKNGQITVALEGMDVILTGQKARMFKDVPAENLTVKGSIENLTIVAEVNAKSCVAPKKKEGTK